jgi:hypothetical protein
MILHPFRESRKIMKRRSKKVLINQPTGLESLVLEDIDDSEPGDWATNLSNPKDHRIKSLRKRSHNNLSGINFRHFHRH